jgi:hypothetical protein
MIYRQIWLNFLVVVVSFARSQNWKENPPHKSATSWNFWSKKQQNLLRKKSLLAMRWWETVPWFRRREKTRDLFKCFSNMYAQLLIRAFFFQFQDIENLVNISKDFPVLFVNTGQKIIEEKTHCKLRMSSIAKFIILYIYRNLRRRRCRKQIAY